MKKLFLICSILLWVSCSDDLEDLNVDVKNATAAPAESFFNLALKNMSDVNSAVDYGSTGVPFSISRIWAQQISSVTYNEGATYYTTFTWDNVYLDVLINLQECKRIIENQDETQGVIDPVVSQNKISIIEIFNVYTYSKMVEGFGDIPYSEALDIDNISPAYDDAETVYIDLLARLDTALNNIDESKSGWSTDLMYGGNVSAWKKFGRSLQLQMGMRLADSNPTQALEAINAALPGTFTSNADNAQIEHLSSQPNTSELYVDLAVGNRRDFVGGKPFVDYMNALDDPRRTVFFRTVGGVEGEYAGSPSGIVVPYDEFSEFGDIFYQPTTPVLFLDYSTVEFLLAEAAERNLAGVTDAESHYNAAIEASFEYYNVDGATAYLLQPEVAYDTAPGDWKEKIGMQKWVALFNQGMEAWTEYRRLDYPELSAPPESFVDIVPVRLLYPVSEQTLNRENYEAAAITIGGDLLTTKLFWDLN